MKFDFNNIIELRQKYAVNYAEKDKLLEKILKEEWQDEFAMISFEGLQRNAKRILKTRYIDMIIQIPSPFIGTNINFCIIHCSKNKPTKLLTGIFNGLVYEMNFERTSYNYKDGWQRLEAYSEDFKNFIENIQDYFERKTITREDLAVNPFDIFNENHVMPIYYTKQAVKIRKELEKNEHKLLTDFADVLSVASDKNINAKCINSKNFTYPFDYNKLVNTDIERAIKVEQGDIICLLVGTKPKFYLYNEPYDDVYIKAGNYCIVRCKEPKYRSYIVNYLNDEKARLYFSSSIRGSYIRHILVGDVKQLIVVTPTEKMLKLSEDAQNYIMRKKKISPYEINELIRENYKISYAQESQKMISDDMIKMVSNIKMAVLKELIKDDLNEVEVCFKNGAYKSAIILCGSILEAVLLDWLSEYEDTENLSEVAIEKNGRDLGLSKIIYRLRMIVKPEWYESSKAHEIRETRNMVHPKECIRSNKKITEDECKIIIENLKDIMESKQRKHI